MKSSCSKGRSAISAIMKKQVLDTLDILMDMSLVFRRAVRASVSRSPTVIIDLASSGFHRLRLNILLEAEQNEVREAWEEVDLAAGHKFGDGFHYLDIAGFRKNSRDYRVHASLSTSTQDGSLMTIEYAFGTVKRQKTRRANLNKVGLFLDTLAVSCSVDCVASGDFSTNRFKPIIDLPLIRFNMPYEFFDELRGVRLAKLKDGVESDSVALDMHEGEELHVTIQTSYSTTSSSYLPSDALARVIELKGHAVTETQSDNSEEA